MYVAFFHILPSVILVVIGKLLWEDQSGSSSDDILIALYIVKLSIIINFADTLDPADAIDVQQHVINVLGQFLQWPLKALSERVFLYSAKQALAHNDTEVPANESAATFLQTHDQLLLDIQKFWLCHR